MSIGAPPPLGSSGQRPRPGWWSRNWKWFVPIGCLSMVVLIVVFVLGIVLIVFGAMKSSDAYKTAVTRAQANPQLIAALGAPIEEGMFVSGKTHVDGSSGEADLTIPISTTDGQSKDLRDRHRGSGPLDLQHASSGD